MAEAPGDTRDARTWSGQETDSPGGPASRETRPPGAGPTGAGPNGVGAGPEAAAAAAGRDDVGRSATGPGEPGREDAAAGSSGAVPPPWLLAAPEVVLATLDPPDVGGVRGWLRARPGLAAGLVCGFALVVVGPLLGLLWSVSAPRFDVRAGLSGGESAFAVQSTIDACFGLICAVAGIIAGVVAYRRGADVGWPVPVGLAVGGTAGSLLAGWVGHLRRSADVLAELPPDASQLLRDLVDFQVRATGLYLVLPGTALFVLALLLWAGGTVPAASRRRR